MNATSNFVLDDLNAQDYSTQVIEDLIKSWTWVLMSVVTFACKTYVSLKNFIQGIAFLLGFLWLVLMRVFSGVIVWLTIILSYLLLLVITLLFLGAGSVCLDPIHMTPKKGYKAKTDLDEIPEDERLDNEVRNKNALLVTGFIFLGIFLIMVILLIWMRRRISLAIGIIKEATKALAVMPSLIAFPAFIFLLIAAFYVYWTVIAL